MSCFRKRGMLRIESLGGPTHFRFLKCYNHLSTIFCCSSPVLNICNLAWKLVRTIWLFRCYSEHGRFGKSGSYSIRFSRYGFLS